MMESIVTLLALAVAAVGGLMMACLKTFLLVVVFIWTLRFMGVSV